MKIITNLALGLAFVALLGLLSRNIITDVNGAGNGNGNGNNGNGGNGGNGNGNGNGNGHQSLPPEVTGELGSNQIVFQPGAAPTINWLISRPLGKTNNGHGNNVDGVDSSNPGNGGGGPNGAVDESDGIDDEIKGGDPNTNLALAPNMIRQIDLDSGVVLDIYSDFDAGSSVSGMPITGPLGAIFELWADVGGVLTLLDVRGIGPYMPTANFLVTTADPWQRTVVDPVSGALIPRDIYRTRADIAFSVQVTAGGLRVDPALPLAARAVSIETTGQSGDPDTYLLGPEYAISASSVTAGAPNYIWSGLSQLTGFADPKKELGQQHFSMRTYPDVVTPSWQAGRATVLVWPMASASFKQVRNASGQLDPFVSGQTFDNEVRDILVNYKDLYPESHTYVQMYRGPHVLGTVGVPITVTGLDLAGTDYDVPQNSVPQGIKIRNVDMEEVINLGGNGLYTLEVVTGNLPWINGGAYESVAFVNFTVGRSVRIRGQIGTNSN